MSNFNRFLKECYVDDEDSTVTITSVKLSFKLWCAKHKVRSKIDVEKVLRSRYIETERRSVRGLRPTSTDCCQCSTGKYCRIHKRYGTSGELRPMQPLLLSRRQPKLAE